MEYYVYVFCDPRKPGKFIYEGLDYVFNFEPFYIGSGKGSRYKRHLNPSQLATNHNPFKNRKLKRILTASYNPLEYVILFQNNLSEIQSRKLEIKTIKSIGRVNLKTGPLTNLTDGGEGMLNSQSSLKGKTYEEIHGAERAAELKKEKSTLVQGHKNPMFGKPGTFRGKKLSKYAKIMIGVANSVPILQINKENTIIKTWDSILAASQSLNISPTAIGNCLKKRSKSSGGFCWKYVDTT